MATTKLILLTGATGYIGGPLLKKLEARGCRLRCLARQPEFLIARVAAGTEIVAGDVLDSASLDRVMSGVDRAYYLVHSIQRGSYFSEKDRQAARNFGAAAHAPGVPHFYLQKSGLDMSIVSGSRELEYFWEMN